MASGQRARQVTVSQAAGSTEIFAMQADHFAPTGEPGISWERHVLREYTPYVIVHCLIWRDDSGVVRGILYYYPAGAPEHREEPHSVTMFVDPGHRRQGIGTALVTEALRRWHKTIDPDAQHYSADGLALVTALEARQETTTPTPTTWEDP